MGSILSMQWPVTRPKRSRQVPPLIHAAAGAVHQLRGRVAVAKGILFHNDILRARGHRQQLVGMLQRFWKRDRASVELWIDSVLKKDVATLSLPAPSLARKRRAWRTRSAPLLLHQEN